MVGEDFVPGQRMSTANGEFIPAATIRSGQAGHFINTGPSAQGLIPVHCPGGGMVLWLERSLVKQEDLGSISVQDQMFFLLGHRR